MSKRAAQRGDGAMGPGGAKPTNPTNPTPTMPNLSNLTLATRRGVVQIPEMASLIARFLIASSQDSTESLCDAVRNYCRLVVATGNEDGVGCDEEQVWKEAAKLMGLLNKRDGESWEQTFQHWCRIVDGCKRRERYGVPSTDAIRGFFTAVHIEPTFAKRLIDVVDSPLVMAYHFLQHDGYPNESEDILAHYIWVRLAAHIFIENYWDDLQRDACMVRWLDSDSPKTLNFSNVSPRDDYNVQTGVVLFWAYAFALRRQREEQFVVQMDLIDQWNENPNGEPPEPIATLYPPRSLDVDIRQIVKLDMSMAKTHSNFNLDPEKFTRFLNNLHQPDVDAAIDNGVVGMLPDAIGEIDLSNNYLLGDNGITVLSDRLQILSDAVPLVLANVGMTATGLRTLCTSLAALDADAVEVPMLVLDRNNLNADVDEPGASLRELGELLNPGTAVGDSLKLLRCSRTKTGDSGLEHILRRLRNADFGLRHLFYAYNGVTDRAFSNLVSWAMRDTPIMNPFASALRTLKLADDGITDVGFNAILDASAKAYAFPSLRKLAVLSKNITADALDSMVARLGAQPKAGEHFLLERLKYFAGLYVDGANKIPGKIVLAKQNREIVISLLARQDEGVKKRTMGDGKVIRAANVAEPL